MSDSVKQKFWKTTAFKIISGLLISFIIALALAVWFAFIPPAPPPLAAAPHPDTPQLPAAIHLRDGQHYYTAPASHKLQHILLHHVNKDGLIDYAAVKSQIKQLEDYHHSLAFMDPEVYARWSDERKLCFWINAYNALTLLIVAQDYPTGTSLYGFIQSLLGYDIPANSIRQLPFVWERCQFTVMGKLRTLNDIEHQILRKEFKEARIHMAINCASTGCPPLRNEIYTEHQLNRQLEEQTRTFLLKKEETRIDINREQKQVTLSPILQWFAADFIHGNKPSVDTYTSGRSDSERSVLLFVSRYLPQKDGLWLRNEDYSVTYRDYDWSLNEQN